MNRIKLNRSSIQGVIELSPSKSQTLRAIYFASLAAGESYITNVLLSPDTTAMITACQSFGAKIAVESNSLAIEGVAGVPCFKPGTVIDAGNSGIVLRFMTALAALTPIPVTITGDHSIQTRRPIKPLLQALTQLGAYCATSNNTHYAPVVIQGSIRAGSVTLDGQDSQPISALIYTSLFLAGPTRINVINAGETPWILLSLAWLERLGVCYQRRDFSFYEVVGKNALSGFKYRVPGDFSTLLFPLVAALITRSEVTIKGLLFQDPQGDKEILELLKRMGAEFVIDELEKCITVQQHQGLNGIYADLNACVDALPIMAALACYAKSESHFVNVAIARKKESDRIDAICSELTKLGAKITATYDEIHVIPSVLKGSYVNSHQDHRIAMALAVAALGADGETVIDDCTCINKSYGAFVNDFKYMGANLEVLA